MRKFTFALLLIITLAIPNAFAQTKNEGVIPKFRPYLESRHSSPRLPQAAYLPDLDSVIWYTPTGERMTKEEYSFDSKGNLTLLVSYRWTGYQGYIKPWNNIEDQWFPWNKKEISYDESGQDTTIISYEASIDSITRKTEWSLQSKTLNKYDGNGYLIQRLNYTFSPYPEKKAILSYTQDITIRPGSESNTIWQIFRSKNESSATRYEYNEDGNIKLIAECTPNSVNGGWWDIYTKTYVYDGNGTLIKVIELDAISAAWYHFRELEIKYDDQFRPVSANITRVHRNDPSEIINTGSLTVFYKKQPAGLNKINPANINIWSNDQFIHIESESNLAYIRIYNLSGNLLYQATSKGNRSIIPSPVRHGIFLVNVKGVNGKSKTEKIRIQ